MREAGGIPRQQICMSNEPTILLPNPCSGRAGENSARADWIREVVGSRPALFYSGGGETVGPSLTKLCPP